MHIYFLLTTNTLPTLPTFSTHHNQVLHTVSDYTMSTASYLLLFFLCVSLHACYARHLSPLSMKLQQEKSHFSIKLNEGPNKTETRLVGDSEKPRNRRISTNHRVHQAVKTASGSLQKSLVSVSWHVPHNKKPRQKHPGFDLDYSPPKTHPPHHN